MRRLSVVAALVLLGILAADVTAAEGRLVVLAFDGADASMTERWMADGHLPHLARLAEGGGYARLEPPVPAHDAVVWSSFATGLEPDRSGVYAAWTRDPGSYRPVSGLVSEGREPFLWGEHSPLVLLGVGAFLGWLIAIGFVALIPRARRRWRVAAAALLACVGAAGGWWVGERWLPSERLTVVSNLRGTPFWDLAASHGIATAVCGLPVTYPARAAAGCRLLAGPGVADGGMGAGRPILITSDRTCAAMVDDGRSPQVVVVDAEQGSVTTSIPGLPNRVFARQTRVDAPLVISIGSDRASVEIETCGQRCSLRLGQWSPWIELVFPFNPLLRLRGLTRFRLVELDPHLRLYVCPIQLDPEHLPLGVLLSSPSNWAARLKRGVGHFRTVGVSLDPWGRRGAVVEPEVLVEDALDAAEGSRELLRGLLAGDERLLVHAFDFVEGAGRLLLSGDVEGGGAREDVQRGTPSLLDVYRLMDSVVGEVVVQLGPSDTVVVLSGHGLAPWRRTFNLNGWLVSSGYLRLGGREPDRGRDGEPQVGVEAPWSRVDWDATRAFSPGFGTLFINLEGRESRGAVAAGVDYERIRQDLTRRLEEAVDPETGLRPVLRVLRREELYRTFDATSAPDLIVTTSAGFAIPEQGTPGLASAESVLPNHGLLRGASGSLDPALVPGVLFANLPVDRQRVSMNDVCPTVLMLLGLEPPEPMTGTPFLGGTR